MVICIVGLEKTDNLHMIRNIQSFLSCPSPFSLVNGGKKKKDTRSVI